MLETAAHLRPEDGEIVDSLGWVMLRQGDADQAVGMLERAAELEPADATINAHLGDAYWAVGPENGGNLSVATRADLQPAAGGCGEDRGEAARDDGAGQRGAAQAALTELALAEFAPAKVNLFLHVTGRRTDGYHLLDSLVVFAGIGDTLRAERSAEVSLTIDGPFASGLSAGEDNLVVRAVRRVGANAGRTWGRTAVDEGAAGCLGDRRRLGGRGCGVAADAPTLELGSGPFGGGACLSAPMCRCAWQAGRPGWGGLERGWSRRQGFRRAGSCWSIRAWRWRRRMCSGRGRAGFRPRRCCRRGGPTCGLWPATCGRVAMTWRRRRLACVRRSGRCCVCLAVCQGACWRG